MSATLSSRTQARWPFSQLGHQHRQPAAAALDDAEDAGRVPLGLGRHAQAHLAAGLAVERGALVHARDGVLLGALRVGGERLGRAGAALARGRELAGGRRSAEPAGLAVGVVAVASAATIPAGTSTAAAAATPTSTRRRPRSRPARAGLGRRGGGCPRPTACPAPARRRSATGSSVASSGWADGFLELAPSGGWSAGGLLGGRGSARTGARFGRRRRRASTAAQVSASSSSLRMWPRSAPRCAPRSVDSPSMAAARRRATSGARPRTARPGPRRARAGAGSSPGSPGRGDRGVRAPRRSVGVRSSGTVRGGGGGCRTASRSSLAIGPEGSGSGFRGPGFERKAAFHVSALFGAPAAG